MYYNKYLKYKQKYLEAMNQQMGGEIVIKKDGNDSKGTIEINDYGTITYETHNPNTDNTPDWAIEPVEYNAHYKGKVMTEDIFNKIMANGDIMSLTNFKNKISEILKKNIDNIENLRTQIIGSIRQTNDKEKLNTIKVILS